MSASTKRKHVKAEALDGTVDVRPDTSRGERVARLVAPRGNNLHEVESPDLTDETKLENFLVSMPNKFRKSLWVKRGDYVVVSPIQEGDKVKGEILRVLYKEQIKQLKADKCWPQVFLEKETAGVETVATAEGEESDEGDDDSDLFQNTNRPAVVESETDEESSESEAEEEETKNSA